MLTNALPRYEHFAASVQVPELGRVGVLEPELQDARDRRVGLLDEIRFCRGARAVVVSPRSGAEHDRQQGAEQRELQ